MFDILMSIILGISLVFIFIILLIIFAGLPLAFAVWLYSI